ncbi:MAG: hypothetical protein EOO61_10525 [Hymenobacter sp.]|nr:MAG: hypothetical protein EOO61_10525 [Hymenobacter sp.]
MKLIFRCITCFLCCFLFIAHSVYAQESKLDKLILSKKGYSQNAYPHANAVFSFAVMDPGVVLVPVAGGIYLAGWQKWFLMPSKKTLSFAADYCKPDSSIYFFATDKTKSFVLKSAGDEKKAAFVKIVEMPAGVYGLKAVSAKVLWIWGKQDGFWGIWKYDYKQLKLVYKTDLAIVDVAPLNENNLAVATTHSILTVGSKQAPREVIKMDVEIDGLAINYDATLFVSTEKGILHYLSPEFAEDAEVVTYGIHGVLRRYQKSLYVLWQEDNQVVGIKL